MKWSNGMIFAAFAILTIVITGCASAPTATSTPASTETPAPTSTPEDTATPPPTSTATPIPIPGIDEPIVVNEVSVQLLEAKWEEPVVVPPVQLKEGYRSLMITFKLQSEKTNSPADLMNAIEFREMRVVDDQGNESPVVFFNLPISSLTGSEYAQLGLYFAVLEDTIPKTVHFVDGQAIELVTLLPPQ
ncbi:MAG: hypothetical protein IT312_06450 [Anaerolineales bacterium]|nr:hypothetical protein [Anaerolineales bacterium]